MINGIDQINILVQRETRNAIKAVLESALTQDDERQRQKDQHNSVNKRGLHSEKDSSEPKDEADEEEKSGKEKKREDRSKGKGTADSPKLKLPKKDQLRNPTVAIVADKLNALRGGRSLKDPKVRKSFSQYYESLTLSEKQSLVVFLTAIAQILSGAESGADAIDPSDVGLRVKDTDDKSKKTQTSQKDTSNKEGTQENPIVVGEVASKTNIMRALREYSKYSK